jgi:uncharacterized protein (TIGR04255 family)
MPFPPSDREIYDRNPLREVICQLQFPTILQVSSESPYQFQNSIRDQYPLYEDASEFPPFPEDIAEILSTARFPKGLQQPEHRFITENETRLVLLTQEFIALSDKQYEKWEEFRDALMYAEAAFRSIYKPAFYSRIGLRYRDVIDKDELGLEDYKWSDLLNQHIIGELGAQNLEGLVFDIRTVSSIAIPEIDGGVVRIQHGLAGNPDDSRQIYLIDADFYTEERSQLDDAYQILDSFNQCAGRFFRWAIKDQLRDALGPTGI